MSGCVVKSLSGLSGVRAASDDIDMLVSLRDCWAIRYPEAGPHYLALRCWGLLIWQPIYLSIISVECGSAAPDITKICQPVPKGGFICGYFIENHTPYKGNIFNRMIFSAQHLQVMCDKFRRDLAQVVRLNARAAACMQADCVLGAVLATRKCDSALENSHAMERAERWLNVLSLDGCSSFFSYRSNDANSIAINRKICCHNFRRRDGEHCSTCPKLDYGERSIRLNAENAIES